MKQPICEVSPNGKVGCGKPARIVRYMWANGGGYHLAWYCKSCQWLLRGEEPAGLWLPRKDVEALVRSYGKEFDDLPAARGDLGIIDLEKMNYFAF